MPYSARRHHARLCRPPLSPRRRSSECTMALTFEIFFFGEFQWRRGRWTRRERWICWARRCWRSASMMGSPSPSCPCSRCQRACVGWEPRSCRPTRSAGGTDSEKSAYNGLLLLLLLLLHTHTHTHTHTHVHVCVYIYICMYIMYMYVCMYVCMYVRISYRPTRSAGGKNSEKSLYIGFV
jgi:hypothetical protein